MPLIVVSKQLGHGNPAITASVYAHLLSDDQLTAYGDAIGNSLVGEQVGGDPRTE